LLVSHKFNAIITNTECEFYKLQQISKINLQPSLSIQMPLHQQQNSWHTVPSGVIRQLHGFCWNSKNRCTAGEK